METSCKVIGILDLSKRARFDVNASDVMAHGWPETALAAAVFSEKLENRSSSAVRVRKLTCKQAQQHTAEPGERKLHSCSSYSTTSSVKLAPTTCAEFEWEVGSPARPKHPNSTPPPPPPPPPLSAGAQRSAPQGVTWQAVPPNKYSTALCRCEPWTCFLLMEEWRPLAWINFLVALPSTRG